MTEPSKEEREIIQQFRENVSDILKTEEHKSDYFLMRWLRARDGSLEKAEAMIRTSFKWREENNIDQALNIEIDPFIKENYPYSISGRDLGGRPVFEVCVGQWDVRKALDGGKEKEFMQHANYIFEDILEEIRKSNKGRNPHLTPHTQFAYIVDWDGYSYGQLLHWQAVSHLLKFASQYEAHYPEIMYKAVFINCPRIFPLFLALLKTILAPKTLAKIPMFGSNREEWEPALDLLVSEEQRGQRFGGYLARRGSRIPEGF